MEPGRTQSGQNELVIRLFGRLTVERDGVPVTGLQMREGYRLLAYLVLHHGQAVSYRSLAERFWPAEARATLQGGEFPSTRQAIRALRVALGPDSNRLQTVGKGVIRLDLTGASIDLIEFDEAASSTAPLDWQRALAISQQPLLDGWTDAWAEEARCKRQHRAEQLRRDLTAKRASDVSLLAKPVESEQLEEAGGAVPLNSPFYIVRRTDKDIQTALQRRDAIILIKGARQMGKTSLLARGLQQARATEAQVALTDFQSIPESSLTSLEDFFFTLATRLAVQLGVEGPRGDWEEDFDPSLNLERFLQRVLQEKPLLWGLDEVDRLFAYPFRSEVFGLFRSWHNRRALDPTGPWANLTLAIAYATEAHLFITDPNQSPFNVGTRLQLQDFTREETAELNQRYGSPLPSEEAVSRFYHAFCGHPFLSRLALNQMVGQGYGLEEAIEAGKQEGTPFDPHLRRLLILITSEPALTEAMRAVLRGCSCPDITTYYRLRSAGLIVGESQSPRPRCRLYADYFSRHLR